jgi:hypothetical protein
MSRYSSEPEGERGTNSRPPRHSSELSPSMRRHAKHGREEGIAPKLASLGLEEYKRQRVVGVYGRQSVRRMSLSCREMACWRLKKSAREGRTTTAHFF